MLKFASLKYDHCSNLGDEIQSLAVEQFLPRVDKKFDRDSLRTVSEPDRYLVIMNGYFSRFPERSFPPSPYFLPVFFGFHIRTNPLNLQYFLSPEIISYLKQHEPIGCRDRHTMALLQQHGVQAFFSKCLTLTFPRREKEPEDGRIFLVDTGEIPLPKEIRKNSVKTTHLVSSLYGDEIKTSMARKLLQIYKNHASLVITTRIHCALPCLAMGIPVIFFGDPDDPRISLIKDLKVPIYPYKRKPRGMYKLRYFRKLMGYLRLRRVDWQPRAPDLEELKANMRQTVTELIQRKLQSI